MKLTRRIGLSPFVSLVVLAAIFALWFTSPAVREGTTQAYEVLTSGEREAIQGWIRELGPWGPMMIIGAMTAQMFLIVVPSWGLMIVAVLVYGPIWGTLLGLVAIVIAGLVGYGVGRILGRRPIERFLGRKTLAEAEKQQQRYGVWTVVIARMNPLISNDAISFIAGVLAMPLRRFLLASLAGITPLAVLIGLFGSAADQWKNGLVFVGMLALLSLVTKVWFDRH